MKLEDFNELKEVTIYESKNINGGLSGFGEWLTDTIASAYCTVVNADYSMEAYGERLMESGSAGGAK